MPATGRQFVALWLAAWSLAASAQEPVPLAVEQGQCSFVLPAGPADDQYCLVIASLAREGGPFPVQIRTAATNESPALRRDATATSATWSRRINEWRLYLERMRGPARSDATAVLQPNEEREFRLAAGLSADGALPVFAPGRGKTVLGQLAGVGRYCQVYVDRDSPARAETASAIVELFDEEILPQALPVIGRAADIDGDSRFTILLTELPAHLGGYVWHQDFDRQGTGNRCDLMVVNRALQPGPHLRALLMHEYAHAVVCSAAEGLVELPRWEEDWLNEAIAHVAEAALGSGGMNLDYRIAAYRNAPEQYPLVVPDHCQAGLWRCPGHRGAGYLFLQHCVERHGLGLLRQLVRTPLTGVNNLEVATGEAFPDLFRAWCVAQAFTSRWHDLPTAAGALDMKLTSTAVSYVQLHAAAAATKVIVQVAPQAQLQVSLLKLPAGRPHLAVQAVPAGEGVQLVVTAHDTSAVLQSVSWLPLVPRSRSELHEEHARSCFSTTALQAGETARSVPLPLPSAGQSIIFKVVSSGMAGQVAASWCVLEVPQTAAAGWSAR